MTPCTLCGTPVLSPISSLLSGTLELLCQACADAQKRTLKPACDFCSRRPTRWAYPAESYVAPATPRSIEARVMSRSVDQWLACDTCHEFIESEQWVALAQWALEGLGDDLPDRASVLHDIRTLHAKFQEYRTGPCYPEEGFP